MVKTLLKTMLLLCALVAGRGIVWAAEGDVHDMNISQSQLLNNNATIDAISIEAQSYPVKTVTINWKYNKTITNPVTIEVLVGDTSWGTQTITGNTTADAVFNGESTTGAITINFTNNTGSGTGHGTFYVNSVKLTEGAAAVVSGTTAAPSINGETSFLGSTTVTINNAATADGAAIYYTLNGDDPTTTTSETCFLYSVPFEISATTTVKAIAKHVDDDNASSVVSKTFTNVLRTNIAAFVAEVASGETGYLQLTDALVTYKNGTTAYLEDASGAIMLYQCASDLAAGDKITGIMNVTDYSVYNNLPEIKDFTLVEGYTKTSGNTVTPTEVTLSTLLADYNSYLSRYIIIKGATVTSAFSSKNCTIKQGENTIVLRDQNSTATLTSTANTTVNVTANVAIYSSTKQLAVYEQSQIVEVELLDNAITGINDAYTLDLVADGGISTLDLSAAAATSGTAVQFEVSSATMASTEYDLDGAELTVSTKGTIVIRAYVDADDEYKETEKTITVTILGEKDDAVIAIANQSLAYGASYTLVADDDYLTDGVVTLSSSNAAIASVDNTTLTVTAAAVGTATITVNAAEGTEYKAGTGTFTVTVTAPEGLSTAPSGEIVTTFTNKNLDYEEGGIAWTASKDATAFETSGNARGVQFGAAIGTFTLTASNSDVITKVSMVLSTNAGTNTVAVKVGNTDFKTNNGTNDVKTLTLTNGMSKETVDFTGTASGNVVISVDDNNKSVYFKSITLTRKVEGLEATLNAYGFATFCSEYPLDFTNADGYTAWQITDIDSNNKITFTQITGSVKGGTGIFLKGEAGATVTLTSADSSTELTDNLLEGTLAPTYVASGEYYGLSGDSFVKVNAGTVKAGKAILDADWITEGAGSRFTFVFADEASGISETELGTLNADNAIYNLNGQRVSAGAGPVPARLKGLYIVNGKKVVMK